MGQSIDDLLEEWSSDVKSFSEFKEQTEWARAFAREYTHDFLEHDPTAKVYSGVLIRGHDGGKVRDIASLDHVVCGIRTVLLLNLLDLSQKKVSRKKKKQRKNISLNKAKAYLERNCPDEVFEALLYNVDNGNPFRKVRGPLPRSLRNAKYPSLLGWLESESSSYAGYSSPHAGQLREVFERSGLSLPERSSVFYDVELKGVGTLPYVVLSPNGKVVDIYFVHRQAQRHVDEEQRYKRRCVLAKAANFVKRHFKDKAYKPKGLMCYTVQGRVEQV